MPFHHLLCRHDCKVLLAWCAVRGISTFIRRIMVCVQPSNHTLTMASASITPGTRRFMATRQNLHHHQIVLLLRLDILASPIFPL